MKTTSILMLLASSPIDVPKGLLKEGGAECVQSSLRDWNLMNGIPGVETPGYSRGVPKGLSSDSRKALASTQTFHISEEASTFWNAIGGGMRRNCYERLLTPAATRIKNWR